jgi:hypothetical protein
MADIGDWTKNKTLRKIIRHEFRQSRHLPRGKYKAIEEKMINYYGVAMKENAIKNKRVRVANRSQI